MKHSKVPWTLEPNTHGKNRIWDADGHELSSSPGSEGNPAFIVECVNLAAETQSVLSQLVFSQTLPAEILYPLAQLEVQLRAVLGEQAVRSDQPAGDE